MNLNTLPDELVAGIFKYTNYVTLHTIRKMDFRMSRIAVKYDIGVRIPVEEVVFGLYKVTGHVKERYPASKHSVKFDEDIWKYLKLPNSSKIGQWSTVKRVPDSQKRMESLMRRVQIRGSFMYTVIGTSIDDSYIDSLLLQKQCFRKAKEIMFASKKDEFRVTGNKLRQFLSNFKQINDFICCAKDGLANICQTEVFCDSKWNSLKFWSTEPFNPVLNGIDQNFLFRVIGNCEEFTLLSFVPHIRVAFTVTDLIDLIEKYLHGDGFFLRKWNLSYVPLGNTTLEKADERLAQFDLMTHKLEPSENNMMHCSLKMPVFSVEINFYTDGNLGNIQEL